MGVPPHQSVIVTIWRLRENLTGLFSRLEGKDDDSYEEYGAMGLNQREYQDILSQLSRNHGDETDKQSLGLTAPVSEAQANIQLSQMLQKMDEMSRSVDQGFVRVQNVTMETNKNIEDLRKNCENSNEKLKQELVV